MRLESVTRLHSPVSEGLSSNSRAEILLPQQSGCFLITLPTPNAAETLNSGMLKPLLRF